MQMSSKVWSAIKEEVALRIAAEPSLEKFLTNLVLKQSSISSATAAIIASKIRSDALASDEINNFIKDAYTRCANIEEKLEADLEFFKIMDPACQYYSTPLLFYKGFLALSTYRAAHCLWNHERHTMALFLQNRASEVFGVDIHPAAHIAEGVMIDHGTGVVIGETSVIEANVSIFQGVTLGGRGFSSGKRHPNIKKGASIFASSTILGDITVGERAVVAAGSLVLKDVGANTSVAGIPAKIISKNNLPTADWDPGDSGL
jgi:serine O-acetyltransferase